MAKKPVTPDTPRRSYRVASPVRLDGDQYDPGEQVDLTDAQAAELAAVGAVDPKPVEPPAEEPPAA